jgi:endonuclease-3
MAAACRSSNLWGVDKDAAGSRHSRIYSTKQTALFRLKRAYNLASQTNMPARKNIEAHAPSASDIHKVCDLLERTYKNPRHGNPRRPLDDLIYIILSTRTRDLKFRTTFRNLKRAFPGWDSVHSRNRSALERILVPAGLGRLKAAQIIDIITGLRLRFGRATLAPLAKMTDAEAEHLLTSLPGVGPKVAKCVLMYALGRNVLPVDVHVHRLATRLGFRTKKRPDTSQELIESAVPPELRYSFHVNAVAHGRAVCLSQRPRCGMCPISKWCRYYLAQGAKN